MYLYLKYSYFNLIHNIIALFYYIVYLGDNTLIDDLYSDILRGIFSQDQMSQNPLVYHLNQDQWEHSHKNYLLDLFLNREGLSIYWSDF